jgi:hypothetical protein
MFYIPRLYNVSAHSLICYTAVRLYPILLMSILLYCYEQLRECISQVEPLMVKVEDLQKIEQDSQPQQSKLFDFY